MKNLAYLLLPAILFAANSAMAAETLNVKITAPNWKAGARAKISLYGYDRNLADAKASLLRTYYKKLEAADQSFSLAVDSDIHRDIDQEREPVQPEEASYYVVVEVDANGDGRICPGDYRQDFDKSATVFFTGFPTQPIQVLMTKISRGVRCQEM